MVVAAGRVKRRRGVLDDASVGNERSFAALRPLTPLFHRRHPARCAHVGNRLNEFPLEHLMAA
jgi:hypothetical protein